jgi:hypothetical protein
MYSESVCQVARSWVVVDSFHTCLVVMFMNFTAPVQNILDTCSYLKFYFFYKFNYRFVSRHIYCSN